MSDTLRVLATASKLLSDILLILNKEETNKEETNKEETNKDDIREPFEIGCRCKSPEIQDYLHDVLTALFKNHDMIRAIKKETDNIVCLIRE